MARVLPLDKSERRQKELAHEKELQKQREQARIEWKKSPEGREVIRIYNNERGKIYNKTPQHKEAMRKYRQSDNYKQYIKNHNNLPHVKAHQKASQKKYNSHPEVQEKRRIRQREYYWKKKFENTIQMYETICGRMMGDGYFY